MTKLSEHYKEYYNLKSQYKSTFSMVLSKVLQIMELYNDVGGYIIDEFGLNDDLSKVWVEYKHLINGEIIDGLNKEFPIEWLDLEKKFIKMIIDNEDKNNNVDDTKSNKEFEEYLRLRKKYGDEERILNIEQNIKKLQRDIKYFTSRMT